MVEKTRSEWRSKWGFFGWADGRRGARWFRKGKLRSPKPRAGGFHRLRLDEGLLTVSDRVVDPGQQRPSPRWGVARASCNARSGCAETRVRDVLGAYSSLGEKGSRGSAGATESDGVPTRNELGRRRAGTWERNGAPTRDRQCMRRAAHVGCPESTVQPRSKERRMAGTRMCDGLPIGAGRRGRIVPGRDGGRRHAHMCGASGVEGSPGRVPSKCTRPGVRGAVEMES